ncbi:MAG: hypothetical protein U0T83_07080 [Bacteriovoracaceae bacterium]
MNLICLFILIFISSNTFCLDTPKNEEENCFIQIKYIKAKKTLKTETLTFYKKSEKECKKESENFEINFVPHLADKKEVKYKWINVDKK